MPGLIAENLESTQVGIGFHSVVVRFDDRAFLSPEGDLESRADEGWIPADYNTIVRIALGTVDQVTHEGEYVVLTSQRGALRMKIANDGYESASFMNSDGVWTLVL